MSKWDDEPRRDELRAHVRDVAPHRSRKDRRRWCRGKVGVEHVLDVRLNKYTESLRYHDPGRPTCFRPEWWPTSWWCSHERYCTRCGKILVASLDRECPEYTTAITRYRAR